MEIDLVIKYDELSQKGERSADRLRREIQHIYPHAIWERCGEGHRILV